MTRRGACVAVVFAVLGFALGCSSSKPTVKPDSAVAKQKLDAITRLADAMAKNPNSAEAVGALDEFTNLNFDPKSQPELAQQIIDVYDQRIKGKYRGETAQQIHNAVEIVRLGLK